MVLLMYHYSQSNIYEAIFEAKTTSGDTHLGGEDFDNRLTVLYKSLNINLKNADFKTNQRALHRLRTVCERVKRTLT